MASFGDTTRRMRKERGLTLETIAKKAGTHKSYISGIENGKVNPPSVMLIKKIAKALKANEEELVTLAYIDKAPKMIRENVRNALMKRDDSLPTNEGKQP